MLPLPFPLVFKDAVIFYAFFKFYVSNNMMGEVVLLLTEI